VVVVDVVVDVVVEVVPGPDPGGVVHAAASNPSEAIATNPNNRHLPITALRTVAVLHPNRFFMSLSHSVLVS